MGVGPFDQRQVAVAGDHGGGLGVPNSPFGALVVERLPFDIAALPPRTLTIERDVLDVLASKHHANAARADVFPIGVE